MNLSYSLLPHALYWATHVIYAVALGAALYLAPWKRMAKSENHHVFLGACVALLVMWQMKAGILPGLDYHLLGGTLFVLMFGWEFALIGISLVLVGTTLNGAGDWHSFSLNALLMGGIPVLVSYTLYRFAVRRLPHHFFVYVLFNGFFGGILAMGFTVGTIALLMTCCSAYTLDTLESSYLPFMPLMMFAEGFFSGMLTASMVIWRPDWMSTFDDRRYIAGK